MASTSNMNIERHESKVHFVPSQHIFHLSLEHGITSLDVHLPQKLSHLLLSFSLLPMFCLKDTDSQSCLNNLEKLPGCPCVSPR